MSRNWPTVRIESPHPHGKSTEIYLDDVKQEHLHGATVEFRVDDVNRITLHGFLQSGRIAAQGLIRYQVMLGTFLASGDSIPEALRALAERIENRDAPGVIPMPDIEP